MLLENGFVRRRHLVFGRSHCQLIHPQQRLTFWEIEQWTTVFLKFSVLFVFSIISQSCFNGFKRFQTAAGCSSVRDEIKVAGWGLSLAATWSQLVLLLDGFALCKHAHCRGGPPRIWSKMGVSLKQDSRARQENTRLVLEDTKMKYLLLALTWSYLFCTWDQMTLHNPTHPVSM